MAITLYYFLNKKGKQQIDRLSDMLSFVWLFSFLTNQKKMLSLSRQNIFEDL